MILPAHLADNIVPEKTTVVGDIEKFIRYIESSSAQYHWEILSGKQMKSLLAYEAKGMARIKKQPNAFYPT